MTQRVQPLGVRALKPGPTVLAAYLSLVQYSAKLNTHTQKLVFASCRPHHFVARFDGGIGAEAK